MNYRTNRNSTVSQQYTRLINRTKQLIERLIDKKILKGVNVEINEREIYSICQKLPEIFQNETITIKLNLKKPIVIVGDLFGHYGHLLRLLNIYGYPPHQRYLFLGNYVDNGKQSIELITLLFAYKLCYPDSIYLLRGKHECTNLTIIYDFYKDCITRFSKRLWKQILRVFDYMPILCIIEKQILCVHSGLTPIFEQFNINTQTSMFEFLQQKIKLPSNIIDNRLIMHFIWSDPDYTTKTWDQNPVGMGYLYGPDVVANYCENFNLKQIIRASQFIPNGFEFFTDPHLLTIFSVPDFMCHWENDACLVYLYKNKNTQIKAQLQLIKPIIKLRCKSTFRMNMTFHKIDMVLGEGIKEET